MGQPAERTDDDRLPPRYRKINVFLEAQHLARLDKEALRRKAVGDDKDPETGQRINVNRSTIMRDLVDTLPE